MKRNLISALLVTAMVASMVTGCGGSSESSEPAASSAAEEAAPAETSEEGAVLNISCWNDEFQRRMQDHYPGYEIVDGTTGKIGDVTVKWNITPSDDNAYQNKLDEDLLGQADKAADEKIDLFLVEADYAIKYVDTEYALPVSQLGLSDADFADQYQYTKDVVTDSNGELKGVSWQGCPGVLIYNREAAKEVLGSDDPATVQEAVKDWDTFLATAATMNEAGYKMTATSNDAYRVFSNNVTSKWVENGEINIDDNLMKWAEMSKEMVDAGYTDTQDLWSDDWSKGFYPEGKVFCYFGPAWLIDFCMAKDVEGSIANQGGWAATEGPQGFFWGGTWICGATGTDNEALVKDIMLTMTTDETVMKEIVTADNDFVNNKNVMNAMAEDKEYGDDVLGGQNAIPMFCAGVEKIDLSNLSNYDQGCNEEFQNAMKNYFEGTMTMDEALASFQTKVGEKYPELAK